MPRFALCLRQHATACVPHQGVVLQTESQRAFVAAIDSLPFSFRRSFISSAQSAGYSFTRSSRQGGTGRHEVATVAKMITTPHERAYKWWVVAMLWFICFFN